GGQFSGPYLALSISGTVVAASENQGGASAGLCGAPKLSKSTNLTAWTTCGFDAAVIDSAAGRHLNLRHAPDGKLVMAFHYPITTNPKVAPGVVVWREP
ncbi:MAG: hypothetical protein H6Q89_3645, partial [Myxococcaceae bacterium]|nr:hypothetical protein [Myxococcaceae bacterium]